LPCHVLVVYAASGTGKSSLLNAGLLPIIEQDPTLLSIVVTDPHQEVLQVVRQEFVSIGWMDDERSDDVALAETLERHFNATGRRVILVLDQFEERLKQRTKLDALYAEIARLANTRSNAATVVISIREDYLGGLERLMRRVSGLLDASYRVPNLGRSALVQAVHGPLEAAGSGVTVDDGLVEQVLTDLERETDSTESLDNRMLDARFLDPRIEAGYFQIVWSHLWDKDATKPAARLTRSTYQDEGGATGILKAFVSDTLSQLLPFEAEVLRAGIRYMVLPTGAKVALTVDDLLGLLRADEFTAEGREILLGHVDYNEINRQLSEDERRIIGGILQAIFHQLTRTDAALFRRVVRSGREEYELTHDLLGLILLQWRLQYESERSMAMGRPLGDFSGRGDPSDEHTRSIRLTEKSARHKLNSANELLTSYGLNLKAVETVEAAEKNGKTLRSAIDEINFVARARGFVMVTDELRSTLRIVQEELHTIAANHHSRDMRRVAQREAFEILAMTQASNFRSLSYGTGGVVRNLAAWVSGLVLAVVGIFVAQWTIMQLWHMPDVQYMPLTLGVVAVAAAILYALVYDDEAGGAWLDWTAVKQVLWPGLPRRTEPFQGVASDTGWRRAARSLMVILMWWPIHYLLLGVACFAGAALFQLAGWSPTAGFNLAALVSAIGLGVLYILAADY
jgi:hypothetical protein